MRAASLIFYVILNSGDYTFFKSCLTEEAFQTTAERIDYEASTEATCVGAGFQILQV